MKKNYYGYLCALLLSVPQFNQAGDPKSILPSHEIVKIIALGAATVVSLAGCMTYYCVTSKQAHLQQRIIEKELFEAKQKAEKAAAETRQKVEQTETAKKIFHLVQNIQSLNEKFSPIRKINPEHQTEAQRRIFLNKIIETAGSITTFEEQVKAYERGFEKLDPQSAQEHQEVKSTVEWIKANMHTNAFVQEKKEIEKEIILKERERASAEAAKDAQLKKIQNEAKAAENLVRITEKVENLIANVDSTVTRTAKNNENQLHTLELSLNRRLAEFIDIQGRRTSEHKETIRDILELKNKLINMESDAGNRLQIIEEYLLTLLHHNNPPASNPHYQPNMPTPSAPVYSNTPGYPPQQAHSQSGQPQPQYPNYDHIPPQYPPCGAR